MGNTASISSNILVFPSPEPSKRVHRHWTQAPVHGSSHSSERSSSPRYLRTSPGHSPKLSADASNRPPSLACYRVSKTARAHILSTLAGLCNDLRLPYDRLARKAVGVAGEEGWTPQMVFHLSGDFQTAHSNSLVSVLFTKVSTRTCPTGEHEMTSAHSWLHVYDAGHLAQSFSAVLKDMVYRGSLRELDTDAQGDVLQMLEACALVSVKYWVEGGQDQDAEERADEEGGIKESGIVEKMMGQLEGLLWEVWLEAEDDWEGEGRGGVGGCLPS